MSDPYQARVLVLGGSQSIVDPLYLLSGSRTFRFFETEGIAILTMLVSRYKIEVKEEPQFAGETFKARRDRILACKPGLTLT
jgi:hypothetical protein